MDADDISRAVWRIAHEIVERNRGTEGILILGIPTRGAPLAARLATALQEIEILLHNVDIVALRIERANSHPGVMDDDLLVEAKELGFSDERIAQLAVSQSQLSQREVGTTDLKARSQG